MNQPALEILFVCKGNLFRSVLAEVVFRKTAQNLGSVIQECFSISSCGIDAKACREAHPDLRAALTHLGIEAPLKSPLKLSHRLVDKADLLIAMTRQQSYLISNQYVEHREKCFSLLEINGAIWTLLGCPDKGLSTSATPYELFDGLFREKQKTIQAIRAATDILKCAPREEMYPLEGIKIGVFELMSRFSTCFNQISAIHDPLCGPREEVLACAEKIEQEVKKFLFGLVKFARRVVDRS